MSATKRVSSEVAAEAGHKRVVEWRSQIDGTCVQSHIPPHPALQLRAFSERPDYLAPSDRGLAAGAHWPVDYGPELSRGFRALKVWSHLTEHGTEKLGAAITRNVEQAAYLAGRVDASPSLRRLAPAAMQIVVFRYEGGAGGDGTPEEEMDRLNDLIVVELQERGIAAPSTTKIEGKLAIRVNITNHRTRFEDLDLLVAEVEKLGKELSDNN